MCVGGGVVVVFISRLPIDLVVMGSKTLVLANCITVVDTNSLS